MRNHELFNQKGNQRVRDASANVVASVKNDHNDLAYWISTVEVNKESVECLFDTGATCCAVERELVNKSAMIAKEAICTLTDTSVKYFLTTNVDIENEYFRENIETFVMQINETSNKWKYIRTLILCWAKMDARTQSIEQISGLAIDLRKRNAFASRVKQLIKWQWGF